MKTGESSKPNNNNEEELSEPIKPERFDPEEEAVRFPPTPFFQPDPPKHDAFYPSTSLLT